MTLKPIGIDDEGQLPVRARAALAGNLADVATPEGAALWATIADLVQRAPSYVPANRVGLYDPARGTYNLKQSNTAKTRAKLALARGGTGVCKIMAGPADSMTAGETELPATNSWPVLLRKALAASGMAIAGTGVVFTVGANPRDARWTLTGWTGFSGSTNFCTSATDGSTATFTSDLPGTSIDVWFLTGGGEVTIQIDAEAPVSYTPPAGSLAATVRTFSGRANTVHTVTVRKVGTTTSHLIGVRVYGGSGLEISNAARSGTRTGQWLNAPNYELKVLPPAVVQPDAALVCLFYNDAANAITPAAYKTNLLQIVTNYQTAGIEVLLTVPPRSDPAGVVNGALWETFAKVVYEVADEKDVPLLDVSQRFGSYASAFSNGLMRADGVHQTAAGYAMWAMLWYHALAA